MTKYSNLLLIIFSSKFIKLKKKETRSRKYAYMPSNVKNVSAVGGAGVDLRKFTPLVNSDLHRRGLECRSNGRLARGSRRACRPLERRAAAGGRSSAGNKSPAFQLGPLLVSDNRASNSSVARRGGAVLERRLTDA